MIWTIVVVIFVLWLLGWAVHFGGDLIHLLLVLVLIGIVYQLFTNRRTL